MKVVVIVNITPKEAKELQTDGWMNYNGIIVYDPAKATEFSKTLKNIRRRRKN